jgi:transcriptional regulator with XRE-family HTH domain
MSSMIRAAPPHSPDEPRAEKRSLLALGRRVRGLRESLRLTQDEFATRCGISVSFASLLERGERSPSYETLLTIARALEVPVSDLFREGITVEPADPSHSRLLDFARKAQLSRQQVDRFIAVGHAMFGLEREPGLERTSRCAVEGCGREVLARGLCAPHYHRARRARLLDESERK